MGGFSTVNGSVCSCQAGWAGRRESYRHRVKNRYLNKVKIDISFLRERSFDKPKLETALISEPQKNAILQVVISVSIVLLSAWHVLISCDYPYYFIWDMDYITVLDTVLIQSGLLPDHISHPSFGMYLPLFFSEKIAYLLGVLSALDLEDLAGSINPIAAMAELTDFVRLHSPFLSVGTAVLLCMAIRVMFGISRWYFLLFLFVLGSQESLTYHSSMVRSELYSVFYWSGAVLTMAMAAKAASPIKKWGGLLVTGLLLGLCFLTKIQSLFYIAALMVLLLLVFSFFQAPQKQERRDIKRKGAYWILAVSLFNVIAFLVLGIASYSTPVPRGVPTWAVAFGVTPIAVTFFLPLLLLFLCQLFLWLTNRVSSDTFRFSCFFSVIAAGFMLCFAFYFLLYSDVSVSLNYMLLNFKMVFLRVSKLVNITEPLAYYISNFLSYLYYNPTIFVVNIALNLLLVFGYLLGFLRITRNQVVLCLLITILAFVNIVVGTRFILRDIIWKEVLLNFASLLYFAVLVSRATRYRLTLAGIGSGLLVVLFFVNCIHTHNMPERIDANYNHYGWWEDKFFSSVYGGNQRKYKEIIQKKYTPTTAWIARTKAVDHKRIRRTVDFVFKNQTITHRNIGIVFDGFSAWSKAPDYRIAEAPPALQGSILVDNASLAPERTRFFNEEYVRQHSEYLDKFKNSSPAGQMSVLTRRDLKIFLFVNADDVSSLVSEQIVQTPYKIVLRNTEQSIELQGLEIKNYCEIPLDKIVQKFFFVIRKI